MDQRRNGHLRYLLMAILAVAYIAQSSAPATAAATTPNIVFILADDLGWSDLGCYGSTFYEDYEDARIELYHLTDDVREHRNLATQKHNKAAELLGKLHAWQERVDAQMPRPNPHYDPNPNRRYQGGRSFFSLKKRF